MYHVYILQSEVDNSFYIGHTNNMDRRLFEHNNHHCKYTRTKAPWNLVYQESFDSRGDAMKRELEIKNKKRVSYIEYLIGRNG